MLRAQAWSNTAKQAARPLGSGGMDTFYWPVTRHDFFHIQAPDANLIGNNSKKRNLFPLMTAKHLEANLKGSRGIAVDQGRGKYLPNVMKTSSGTHMHASGKSATDKQRSPFAPSLERLFWPEWT